MTRGDGGIWRAGPADDPTLADFAAMVGAPYMFRITKDDGSAAYRTDLWSLMQIGAGDFDPDGAAYAGPPEALDGPQSCSVVCDPAKVVLGPAQDVSAEAFWADEFVSDRPLPTRIEDLVIYELHMAGATSAMPVAHCAPSGAHSTSCCPPAACRCSGGDDGRCRCTPRRDALASATSGIRQGLFASRGSARANACRQLMPPELPPCAENRFGKASPLRAPFSLRSTATISQRNG
jgi:hypothetical protein